MGDYEDIRDLTKKQLDLIEEQLKYVKQQNEIMLRIANTLEGIEALKIIELARADENGSCNIFDKIAIAINTRDKIKNPESVNELKENLQKKIDKRNGKD